MLVHREHLFPGFVGLVSYILQEGYSFFMFQAQENRKDNTVIHIIIVFKVKMYLTG